MTHKAVRTRVQPESQLQLNQSVIHWTVEEARKIDIIVLDKVSFALKWVRRSHTDVSCDLQIMSNVHENDVIINVTLLSRIMMSLMGVLSWKWLGGSLTRTSFGLAPLTLSIIECNELIQAPASSWYLPIDLRLLCTRFSIHFRLRQTTLPSPFLTPFLSRPRINPSPTRNLFNFNSKWTLKSWYCSAYYVNLMRYNNAR